MSRLNQLEVNLERARTYEEYMCILQLLAEEEIKQEFGTYTWGESPVRKIPQRFVYSVSDHVPDNMLGPKWITRYYVR